MKKKLFSLCLWTALLCPMASFGLTSGDPVGAKAEPCVVNLTTTDTTCLPITSLPYVQDFESVPAGSSTSTAFVDCWHRLNPASTYFGYPYVSDAASSNFTRGGSHGLYWYGGTGNNYGSYQCLVLPAIDTNVIAINSLQLRFWAKCSYTGSDPQFWIGVMTDPTDVSTFQPMYYTNMMDDGEWSEYILSLTEFTGHGQYVAIKVNRLATDWTACLDDFVLEPFNNCYPVWNLTAAAVSSNSVTLSWYEADTSSSWIVEYGPHGFVPGTGMVDTFSAPPCVVGGLLPSTQYDFYVDPTCSDYRGNYYYSITTTTGSVSAASLPFSCGFENASQNSSWTLANGSRTNRWYIGSADNNGGSNCLFVSDNGTSLTYSVNSPTVVYAYCEVNVPSAGTYSCGFDWKCVGQWNIDYLRAALMPACTTLAGSNITPEDLSVYDLPDGWIALDGGAGPHLQSTWQTLSSTFIVNNPGNYYLTFIFVCDNTFGIDPSGAIDNVWLSAQSCDAPTSLTVTDVASTSAQVSWHEAGSATQWQYQLDSASAVTVTDTFVTLAGLTPATSYNVRVRAVCSESTSSNWVSASFTTPLCDISATASIGSGSSSGSEYMTPVNANYRYSITQTIVDAAELGGLQQITSLSYYYTGFSPIYSKTNCTIYFQPTTLSTFASASSAVALNSSAVAVYTGAMICFPGWNTFELDTPYAYDGTSNLLIVVDDNSNAFSGANYTFRSEPCVGNKTLVLFSDYNNPVPTNPLANSPSSQLLTERAVMRFDGCGTLVCEAPVVSSVATTYYDATVAWVGTGTDYQIAVLSPESADWPEAVSVNANSYCFASLIPSTTYNFRLRQDCTSDQADYSEWTYGSFVTDDLPCVTPTDILVNSISDTGFAISWTVNGAETNWEVHVWQDDANETFATASTPSYEAGNLLSGTQYYVAVRAHCGNDLVAGDWSDTVAFTTLQHFTVTLLANNPAMGSVEGAGSFLAESVARISATPFAGYQFIDWSDGVADAVRDIVVSCDTVLTANFAVVQGINEVDGIVFSVYPNPATSTTTISVAGVNGRLAISVVDVNGRVVASDVEECASDCEKTMDVSNLGQGTYFVRIVSQSVNIVKKLVIR